MVDLSEGMTQGLGLGKLECELATAVINQSPEIVAIGTYSGGILPHGQESAHRRWLEQLHEMQQGFVDMEARAAQMKVALGKYLDEFESREDEPDWEHPRDRKRMSAEVRNFYSRSHGVTTRSFSSRSLSVKQRIPKLTDHLYHNMLIFHQDQHLLLELRRVPFAKAEKALSEKLAALHAQDFNGALSRQWLAVPKHVDGSKGYALVQRFGKGLRLFQGKGELWVRKGESWSPENEK
jgi:hypothetical protein